MEKKLGEEPQLRRIPERRGEKKKGVEEKWWTKQGTKTSEVNVACARRVEETKRNNIGTKKG